MATLYWGGGAGTWNGSSATNWYTNLARTTPASAAPTYLDDVVFDAASNATSYTVTTGAASTGTASFSGTTMTVTAVTAGTLAVGQTVHGLNVPAGVTITALGTGVGGTGTYIISSSLTISSQTFLTGAASCQNFTVAGPATGTVTFSSASTIYGIYVSGSLTWPATGMAFSTFTANILFKATTTGKTITTNGVSMTSSSGAGFYFDGVGGGWTLGSAWTHSGTNANFIVNGAFDTGNYTVTIQTFTASGSNTRSITLGSSTVNISGAWNCLSSTNLTLNAGTSTITCTNASATFSGGGLTYYNLSFTSTSLNTVTISQSNTFNNVTLTTLASAGIGQLVFGGNQTINGTLTIGAANSATQRLFLRSDTVGTQRTITLNGTLAALSDVDFRDINAAGTVATPWTGTRLGNCLNNSNITFAAPKTVYWNLAGAQGWNATGWATTNNGVPAATNFPLAQDTAVFTEAGAAGTVTIGAAWNIGSIQMADGVSNRTTAFTLATGSTTPAIYGNVTLFSSLTLSGTGMLSFFGQSVTQTITSAGITFTQPITVQSATGTFKLADNFTTSGSGFTLTSGTVDLNSKTFTCVSLSSNNSNTRSIAFGTGQITITGNNTTIISMSTATGFTVSGTPKVVCNYSGATGTRTINFGNGATETNVLSVYFTAGTDNLSILTYFKTVDFTGFAGTLANNTFILYGDLIYSTGMTITGGTLSTRFYATSTTQQWTTNGKTVDCPIIKDNGGTLQLQDALTMGSTRSFTLTAGTVQFKAGTTNTVGSFTTTGTTAKYLQSTLAGTQATLSAAAGTNSVSYTTIKDSNATGGATWLAYTTSGNIDGGNTTGWDFGATPVYDTEITYRLRSFTEPRRF